MYEYEEIVATCGGIAFLLIAFGGEFLGFLGAHLFRATLVIGVILTLLGLL